VWPTFSEAYILGCISFTALGLLTQVLWLLSFFNANPGAPSCWQEPT